MDSSKRRLWNQTHGNQSNSPQNNNIVRAQLPSLSASTSHGAWPSPLSNMMQSSSNPHNDTASQLPELLIDYSEYMNQAYQLPEIPKLDCDYSKDINKAYQLPELPNLSYSQYMNQAFAPPYQLTASNGNVIREEKNRISWVGDRQDKFHKVVERLGGLHEATASKILNDMKDPELNYGNVSSHLQHERDIAGIKGKKGDQDSCLTNRKKRRIKRNSSPDHNCRLWTPNLKKKFVSAVQKVGGIKNATANKILKEMCEPTLTRKQVNSHLQSYKKKACVEKEETAANGMKERASDMNNSTGDDEQHGSHSGTTNEGIIINDEEHNHQLENGGQEEGLEEWLNTVLTDDTEGLEEWLNTILTDDTEGLEEWLNTISTDDTEGLEEWLNTTLADDTDKPDRASTIEDTAEDNDIFGNLESIVAIDEELDHGLESNEESIGIIEEEHVHNLGSNSERIIITDDDEREDRVFR